MQKKKTIRRKTMQTAHGKTTLQKKSSPVFANERFDTTGLPLPELLAPVGSPEALRAAVAAGADAVYLGGTMHNARMYAKNFDDNAMAEAVQICHRAGVRVYVTMNTLLWDRELPEALVYAAKLYAMGVDALIVADLGFAALVHYFLPDMPLHASTQMTAQNSEAAKLLASLGFVRMVCPRELPRADVEALVKNAPIEIEQFVHGALCVCHSGQCLASAMIGGRSGNRGGCAQPCRMKYNGGYPISLKDLSLAAHVPALICSGVHSLKIEGRMKSPAYVYGVVSVWRKLLDERRGATGAELAHLAKLFSRSGLTDGYYTERKQDMLGVRTDADKSATRQAEQRYEVRAALGKRQAICIERQPVTLPPNPVEVYLKQRTAALDIPGNMPAYTAGFYTPEQIPEKHPFAHVDLPLERYCAKADGVRLPSVLFERELSAAETALQAAVRAGAKRARVTNLGQLAMVKRAGLLPVGDFRLNVANSVTAAELYALGFAELVVSPELTLPRLRDFCLPKTVLTYGKVPVMLLERNPGASQLKDRMGASFSVKKEAGRWVVHNAVPFYMCDKVETLKKSNITSTYFLFSDEEATAVRQIILSMREGKAATVPIRRIPQK